MNVSSYQSGTINSDHELDDLSCGNEKLDRWLKTQALRAQNARIASVTVWCLRDRPNKVVAYYAISPTQVVEKGMTRRYSGGYSVIPGWLLGRLAVDLSHQGRGVGKQLLLDALESIVAASDLGGGRLIVVDPIDDAAANWYSSIGFASFGPRTDEMQSRMYLTVADAILTLS